MNRARLAVNGERPTTDGRGPANGVARPAMDDVPPATDDAVPTTDDVRPAPNGPKLAMNDTWPAADGAVPTTDDARPAADGAVPTTDDARPAANGAEFAMDYTRPAMDGTGPRMNPVHADYFAGGAGEERTLRANLAAFDRLRIVPRVLRATGDRDLRTTLFGAELATPVLVAPTAFHLLAHPGGEAATALGAAAAGTLMVVSMAANQPVERIAEAGGPLWFQLYPQPDLAFTTAVVRRAEAAGCRALVVTVDSPVHGRRERDRRNGFTDLPAGLTCENMRDDTGRVRDIVMDPELGWNRIAWLRTVTGLPILLKGVLHPADARLAVEHGVDGLIVSNHGGRQLDGAIASIDALPAVVNSVGGRIPVLIDGGVRRGTDVLVALALGADAVLLGRPVVEALARGGADGVREKLTRLTADLDHAMALTGAKRPADLTPDLVTVAR